MVKFGTKIRKRGTGGYKLGRVTRKNHLNMSFNSQSPIADNSSISDAMDVDLIITKAQEQLCLAMEVQQNENYLWHWAEKAVKAQVMEFSQVVASDKAAAEKALKVVIEELLERGWRRRQLEEQWKESPRKEWQTRWWWRQWKGFTISGSR